MRPNATGDWVVVECDWFDQIRAMQVWIDFLAILLLFSVANIMAAFVTESIISLVLKMALNTFICRARDGRFTYPSLRFKVFSLKRPQRLHFSLTPAQFLKNCVEKFAEKQS